MSGRHTSEDLHYLRERGFTETADEIERLHKCEDALQKIADCNYDNWSGDPAEWASTIAKSALR